MANLKELEIDCPRHQKFDDFLTWNIERCTIFKDQFSLRDLNRFFKLWKKGSNRKLKYLMIHGQNIADWNVLLKGLQPEEARRFQAEDDERMMANRKFPFQRLPNDLLSKILKTMDHLETVAFSLTSKKALSLVQTLCLTTEKIIIRIGDPGILLHFDHIFVRLKWRRANPDEEMKSLKDIPDDVYIRPEKTPEHHSLEPNDHDIQNSQNILRAFLPYVENARLSGVPLQENLSIQHIGMANLKELTIESRNPKFSDLLTWNVECCTIYAHQISYHDLSRFFKLWKKGSNPKLKHLMVHGLNVSDWNALKEGLQPENAKSDKEIVIQNCYGIRAKITSSRDTSLTFTWSNQKKSIREWIQHLCSIFQYECQKVNFYTGTIRFDIQSLRNTFPKLEEITIYGSLEEGPSDHDIQSTQIILKAFLPYVQNFHLRRVPLNKNLTIQHIGMANLKELVIYYPRNLKLENLLILNVERYTIDVNQFHLRDLNRFLKLWTKGANSKLKYLLVHGNIETIPAGSVLLKGLQVEEEDEEDGSKLKYTIRNCHGICAQIQMLNYVRFLVSVEFTVLN
ncbi:unnamed protein product [Caenorhabditis nigoni]